MIIDQLVQVIQNIVPESDADTKAWQSVLDWHDVTSSVFHLFNTVEYYVAYYSKNKSTNLSLVLYNNKDPDEIFHSLYVMLILLIILVSVFHLDLKIKYSPQD